MKSEINKFLSEINLVKYEEVLIENGFDDLETVLGMIFKFFANL
jgi:hypothetical protein